VLLVLFSSKLTNNVIKVNCSCYWWLNAQSNC